MADGHTPPKGVQENGERAVRWIEEGRAGKGFTDTGRDRAHQLAKGDDVPEADLKKMHAYFERHEGDADAEGWSQGEDGFPSPGRVAWDAWGGDEGRRWAAKEVGD